MRQPSYSYSYTRNEEPRVSRKELSFGMESDMPQYMQPAS